MTRSTIWLFLVRTTSFKLHIRECLGEPGFERKPKNSGVNGLRSLPPAGPGPDQVHLCFLFLSEQMSKIEKLCQWEGKGGQVKVTLPFLKGVTLDCCICSLWRLTKCSVCRFAGMMASMTWQRRKMDRCPAGWLGWAPSVVCRLATARHTFHGAWSSAAHSPALASPFLKGFSTWAGAMGSPRVPRLRNTALVAAVSRKAETTKYGPCDSGTELDACSAWPQGSRWCHKTEATRAQLRVMWCPGS